MPAVEPIAARRPERDVALAVLLLVAVLFTYWPAMSGGPLWGDANHLTSPELRSLGGLWRIWFEPGATEQYYPLLHSAFWFEHRVWGSQLFGYHVANALLHAASAVLVAVILLRLALPGAWLAAFLFALHPVQVESVAWISEQKNTLAMVFYLGSALAYLRFDETRRTRTYWVALVLFVCALATRALTVTLPAALLVTLWWRQGRLSWGRDVRPLAPWAALGVSAALATAWMDRGAVGTQASDVSLSLLERCLLAGRIVWFYASKLVWPTDLVMHYPRWSIDASTWWQYLFPLALLGVLAVGWRLRSRIRGPLAGTLFFVGTLSPVLGFFDVSPFGFSYVADHFQYIASLGVIVPVVCGVAVASRRLEARGGLAVLGVVVVFVLGLGSRGQSALYQDAERLYRAAIAASPESWIARGNLANELATRPDRLLEAITQFQIAIRLKPEYIDGHRGLARALSQIPERADAAIERYGTVMRLDPGRARDHLEFGTLLGREGRTSEAVRHLSTALLIEPTMAEAHFAMGNVLASNTPDEAIAAYERAIAARPDYTEAYLNLGGVFVGLQRISDAIRAFQGALRIRPDYAEAHYNVGSLLMDMPGRLPEAIGHLDEAVRLNPASPEAHTNLALALLDLPGRTADAIDHLELALQLDPDMPPVRDLLTTLRSTQADGTGAAADR